MLTNTSSSEKKNENNNNNNNNNDNANNNSNNQVKKNTEFKLPKDIGAGLLKFCLTHTDSPNLKESKVVDRDPKDYEWLRAAFDNLEDDAKRMKKILDLLNDDSKVKTIDQMVQSLEQLQFYIEDIDNSGDLIKIGGIPTLQRLMKSTQSPLIRAQASGCLTTICQNEENIQAYFKQLGLLDEAIALLNSEFVPACREKYLSLISSLFGYEIKSIDAVKLEVITKLTCSFLSPTVDLTIDDQVHSIENSVTGMTKACFILRKIFIAYPKLLQVAPSLGIVQGLEDLLLAFNISEEKSDLQVVMVEKVELLLLELLKNNEFNKDSRNIIKQSTILPIQLEKRLKFIKDQETASKNTSNYEDEKKTVLTLLKFMKELK
ncbi:hypothetical protein DLAC_06586 [Tieghemostelium lacteum]|uniref:Nucleotide exchange factor Fes1 domain-containing protein n=1 Tax=Tieghemostelium lacteum TaxID=361077 RepID=A0A151ZFF2_TIELA|nr:hypothetical protein DLAC_06586 [Tieghemostelium lacteum]|eukprot:KYQ92594.1 hypothetical protein DLAC_06586 [Tieghemostelium lacteum]